MNSNYSPGRLWTWQLSALASGDIIVITTPLTIWCNVEKKSYFKKYTGDNMIWKDVQHYQWSSHRYCLYSGGFIACVHNCLGQMLMKMKIFLSSLMLTPETLSRDSRLTSPFRQLQLQCSRHKTGGMEGLIHSNRIFCLLYWIGPRCCTICGSWSWIDNFSGIGKRKYLICAGRHFTVGKLLSRHRDLSWEFQI